MLFRLASPEDAASLLRIYGQYIETAVTFEEVLPTEAEFAERIRSTRTEFPYLVCEDEEGILGYAYAHRKFERAAYRWVAELSVYLDRQVRGKGIGAALYARLCTLLRAQGYALAFAVVTTPNPGSERFHDKLGFLRRAEMPDVGYKNGHWYGIIWFEKRLLPKSDAPKDPIPFPKLDAAQTADILNFEPL